MKQYGMQRRDPLTSPSPVPHLVCYLCYCRTLTYATPSLLPVLLLLFLEKPEGHFDQFNPSQNSWSPTASTLALWWLKFGPTGICRGPNLYRQNNGMFGVLKALCRLRLHNMKKQLVVFFRKKLGLRNFFTHRGGIFVFGPYPP